MFAHQPILGFMLILPAHTHTQPIAECARQAFRTINQAQRIAKSTKIKQTNAYVCMCMVYKWSLMKSDLTMTPNVTSWKLVFFKKVKNTKMLWKAEKLNATNYYTFRLNSIVSNKTHPILLVYQMVCCVWFRSLLFATNIQWTKMAYLLKFQMLNYAKRVLIDGKGPMLWT